MTARRIFVTLRKFGIRGVWNWVMRHFCDPSPFLAALQTHVDQNAIPTKGITLVGDFSSTNSLSKVLRDFSHSLSQIGIQYQILDTSGDIPKSFVFNRYSEIIGLFQDFKVSHLNGCHQHRIIFWEFESGMTELWPELIDGNPILVFSEFCLRSVHSQTNKKTKVNIIRYPFHFEATNLIPNPSIRAKFGIPEKSFMVFYNFDYRSSYYRKNPEGLLSAFIEAFENDDNTVLVFKTNGKNKNLALAEHLEGIAATSSIKGRIFFINEYISIDELVALTAACDIYASLHRGEGFGLGMAEAMSMSKAVVVSNYGANTEFCTPETAELVPVKMINVPATQIDNPYYTWVRQWAEPDTHLAAQSMRKLRDNPQYRNELGSRARAFIKQYYSVENFKRSMDAFFGLSK